MSGSNGFVTVVKNTCSAFVEADEPPEHRAVSSRLWLAIWAAVAVRLLRLWWDFVGVFLLGVNASLRSSTVAMHISPSSR